MFLSTYLSLSVFIFFHASVIASPTSETPPPKPGLSIIQPTELSSIQNDDLHCIHLRNPFSHRTKYNDCFLAIRELPKIPATGAFHNHGPEDPFKLPVQRTINSCTVRVELYAGSSTVAASWPGITTRANTLNQLCLRAKFPTYKGGWATYAKEERIVISLMYADRHDGGDSVNSAR